MADQFDERALYVISIAAELAGVHPQTLRIYERKGLLEPKRTAGNSRRYSERDIARLRRIQELTNDGVSLAGVQMVLELESRLNEARAEIERLHAEMREQLDQVHRSYRRDLVPVPRAVVPYRKKK
ncbi:MAG: heat shock protein transcriptional repressor HspR [Acidimicrobiia bacterium]